MSRVKSPVLRLPSPLQEVEDVVLQQHGVRLLLKRDDLIHPDLVGNKWRKLKYNLEQARHEGASTLLTFGGAYSNHIRATAAAGSYFGFDTIGVIRGEEHLPLNDTLAFAASRGMRLTYLDRTTYRQKSEPTAIVRLREQFGDFYLIPEGGSNPLGVRGAAEIVEEIDVEFDVICCACGTGGTLAGIALALDEGQEAIGISVLKGGSFLNEEVRALQEGASGSATGNWSLELDFHFGGYAKSRAELRNFSAKFEARHGTPLDLVYEAKMMYGLYELRSRGRFAPGTVVVAVIAG
jgi:1-aminocyclopropane-1-carboxylate deaminase